MRTGDLIKRIALELQMTHEEAKVVVRSFIEALKEILKEKRRLELRNFGVFEVKTGRQKRARDFKSGSPIIIEQYHRIKFKPSKFWRS
jgi:nucleoid DNA-binding protein